MRRGFTMAEVLITLGIIGIIAAMTFPSIIENHQKIVTANKLKKFYTIMQQAILLEEAKNEDIKYWLPTKGTNFESWFNAHLAPHMEIIQTKRIDNKSYQVVFKDGSGFIAYQTSLSEGNENYIHIFYCTEKKYCGYNIFDGRDSFLFSICKDGRFVTSLCNNKNAGNKASKDYTREELLNSCKYGNHDNADESTPDKRHQCARLIQYDGWEIKPDYPWRQTILEKK
ncbi:hypothetical protein DBY21_03135 [Candidatus Gastranaerophilales bacterium]|nr:MAG: hypothetical protein DBY21_03135 [Candidatus Gastranaerophilales bacterium]